MKKSVIILMQEAKSKMSAFVALVNYKYMNLCIDAEPASLLSINVEQDGMKFDLEDVADVTNPQKDQFAVYPRESSQAMVFAICKGIKTAHPEFDIEVKSMEENESDDAEEEKYILLTMPKVNKDRHDLLINGVDGLHTACDAKLNLIFQEYTQKIVLKLVDAKPEELDEAKNQLQEVHDEHKKLLGSYTDEKKAQVEEAYQRYLEQQQQQEQDQQEQDEAHGKDKGMSMRFDSEE